MAYTRKNHASRPRRAKLMLATLRHWNADNASMWAASLAFYTMLSLGPLIFLAVTLSGWCLGERVAQDAVMRQIAGTIGPQAASAAADLATAAAQSRSGVMGPVVGVVTLLFGASGVFAALQDAMDAIWHVATRPETPWPVILKRRFLSLAMVAGVAFLLIVSLLFDTLFAALQNVFMTFIPMAWLPAWILDTCLTLALLTLAFAAMYRVLPDAKLKWRDVWSGAATTAFLFQAGKLALSFYFAKSDVVSGYGAAGSLALILLWVYYASQIFFLGAEFIRARLQSEGQMIQPADHAMAVRSVRIRTRDDRSQAAL